MLIFKKLTIKNFMSIGEQPQTIDFENDNMCLILGENQDMIIENQNVARNGAGKSCIFNALSFALFGQALSNIKRDNLVNNINNKNMFVVFEFACNGHNYRIERGRKPAFFKLIIDNTELTNETTDEAQGESKLTQEELEKVIGMSHNLFKHIIALNTTTDPFLKLASGKQREFIEELLGMRILSEKAEMLKELLRVTKDEIKMEEFKVKTLQDSNKKVEKSIQDMQIKSTDWDFSFQKKSADLECALDELKHIDIEQELVKHKKVKEIKEIIKEIERFNKEKRSLDRELNFVNNSIEKNAKSLEKALENNCPTCNQELQDEKHAHIVDDLVQLIETETAKLEKIQAEIDTAQPKFIKSKQELDKHLADENVASEDEFLTKQKTYYKDIEDAYNHKTSIEVVTNELKNLKEQVNPYIEQIEKLEKTSVQEIDFENLNDLVKVRDHQEFLLKLLTSNDSFIRKKIIDQNIAFLNDRLRKYLEKLGLPHEVSFQSNLEVMITNFGREMDFLSLSRGEQTRLILALSFSFRDIFEMLVHPVNAIMIDELLDLGSDLQLVEGAIGILKNMSQSRAKNIFVISHKEELVSKIPTVLKVVKEGGFSTFELVTDYAM